MKKQSRWALGALFALAIAAQSAEAGKLGELVASGDHADVYRSSTRPYKKVWRVMRPYTFRGSELQLFSSNTRRQAANEEARACQKLHTNERFVARFGKIVPNTRAEDSWLEQSNRSGLRLEQLESDPPAQEHARNEMRDAISMAREIVGTVDERSASFVFSPKGDITGWTRVTPMPNGETLGIERIREIGEGANARVWEVRATDPSLSRFSILKILKTNSPRRFPAEGTESVMEDLSKEAEYLAHVLRTNERFQREFGHVQIPDTKVLAPGVILQERATGGVPFDQLPSSAAKEVKREIEKIAALAQEILPGVVVSRHKTNFLYNPETRKIVSWYDIPSDGPHSYQKAGVSQRSFLYKSAPHSEAPR